MIRSVLVQVADCSSGRSALSIASSIAGLADCRLRALYIENELDLFKVPVAKAAIQSAVGQPIVPEPLEPEELVRVEEAFQAEAELVDQLYQAAKSQADIEGQFFRVRGQPSEVVAQMGKTVDFVVLMNNECDENCPNYRGFLSDVMRRTTRPVLAVPPEPSGDSRIVVAFDGSSGSERVLRASAELAQLTELEEFHLLTVLHGSERSTVQREALDYLSAYQFEVVPVVTQGSIDSQIVDYAEEVDASILALGAFGSNRLSELVFGSTTSHIIENTTAAVLLMS